MIYTRAAIFFVLMLFIPKFWKSNRSASCVCSCIRSVRTDISMDFIEMIFRIVRHSCVWQHWNAAPATLRNNLLTFHHQLTATNSKRKQTVGCVAIIYISQREEREREGEPNIHKHRAKQRDVYHFIKTLYARARSI